MKSNEILIRARSKSEELGWIEMEINVSFGAKKLKKGF